MTHLFNNQLKYLSFHKNKNTVPRRRAYLSFSYSSMAGAARLGAALPLGRSRRSQPASQPASHIINRSALVCPQNKNILNLIKNKYGLINSHSQNQLFIVSLLRGFMYNKRINTSSILNNENKKESESLIVDGGVRITDHSTPNLIPLTSNIESVNDTTSPEFKGNNKEKSYSSYLTSHTLHLRNKKSESNENKGWLAGDALPIASAKPQRERSAPSPSIPSRQRRSPPPPYPVTGGIREAQQRGGDTGGWVGSQPRLPQGSGFAAYPLAGKAEGGVAPSNSLVISKNTTTMSSRKRIHLTEEDWKEMWSRKFNKFISLGLYTPDFSDKLLFVYLNEKTQSLKSKYSFNDFFSGSQLINYNFNKNFKKVDLNSLYKYLKSFFKTLSSLISFPVLEVYPDKIKIRLFYYVVPSKKKQHIHKSLHRYIRSDEKLYKELILRRNFKNIMEQFKMKLFIAKWKEDNYFIRTPKPISFFKGLSVTLNEESPIENNRSAELDLVPLNEHLKSFNDEFNRPYEYNISLDLLKLDLSKLSQQRDQLNSLFDLKFNEKGTETLLLRSDNDSSLKSLNESLLSLRHLEIKDDKEIELISSIDLDNKIVDKHSIILRTDVICQKPEECLNSQRSEAEELQSTSTGAILTSKDTKVPILDSKQNNKHLESLTNLKDRKVSTIVSLNRVKFKYLIFTLEKWFKKTIILDLVRLKYPYHESNILAQVLSLSCKTKDFRQIMQKLLYTATVSYPTKILRNTNAPPSIIPSYLSGIKVRLGGRLMTQRVVPRFTVQSLQIGSLARGKVNFTDTSRMTLKNKRGAFSFTVTTSHIFEK